jgi:hypothetical protein
MSSNGKNQRSCASCDHSNIEHPVPGDLRSAMVCRHSPPVIVTVVAQDGTFLQITAWPQVTGACWCKQWVPKEVANG